MLVTEKSKQLFGCITETRPLKTIPELVPLIYRKSNKNGQFRIGMIKLLVVSQLKSFKVIFSKRGSEKGLPIHKGSFFSDYLEAAIAVVVSACTSPVHRYSVDIFSYCIPSGILVSGEIRILLII